jgi:WD40 repeat protein
LIKSANLSPQENVLIVIDQFEELFRYSESDDDELRDDADPYKGPWNESNENKQEFIKRVNHQDDVESFVELLLTASSESELRVYVLITMRSEFLGDCSRAEGLPEAVSNGVYLVPQLTREQLTQAIVHPLLVRGGSISEKLIARLLNDISHDQDQLPVLQHALMCCWQGPNNKIEEHDYEIVGGTAKALSSHANKIFNNVLDDNGRGIAEGLFRSITKPGLDQKGLRRPLRLSTICKVLGKDPKNIPEDVATVIDAFRARGTAFLMPPQKESLRNNPKIDISHESLIRKWDRLRDWIRDESKSGYFYRERLLRVALMHPNEPKQIVLQASEVRDLLRLQKEESWNESWSKRYGGHYEEATSFLNSQEKNWQAESSKRKRTRVLIGLGIVSFVLLLGVVVTNMVLNHRLNGYKSQVDHRLWADLYADTAKLQASDQKSALVYLYSASLFRTRRNGDLATWESFERIAHGTPVNERVPDPAIDRVFVVGDQHEYRVIAEPSFDDPESEFLRAFKFDEGEKQLVPDLHFPSEVSFARVTAISPTGRFVASACDTKSGKNQTEIVDRVKQRSYFIDGCDTNVHRILDSTQDRFVTLEYAKDPAKQDPNQVKIKVWKAAGPQQQFAPVPITLDSNHTVMKCVLSHNGNLLAIVYNSSDLGPNSYAAEIIGVDDAYRQLITGVSRYAPIAFTADSRYLAVGKSDGKIALWTFVNGIAKEMTFPSFAFGGLGHKKVSPRSPNGPVLAPLVSRNDKKERCRNGALLPSHSSEITALAFTDDSHSELLASAGQDYVVRVTDLENWKDGVELCPEILWSDDFGLAAASQLLFSPDSQLLGIALGENTARVRYARTGIETASVTHESRVNSIAFSPNEQTAFSSGADKPGSLLSFESVKKEFAFPAPVNLDCRLPFNLNHQVSVSEDGKLVAAVCPMVDNNNHLIWSADLFRLGNSSERLRGEHIAQQGSEYPIEGGLQKEPECHVAVSSNGAIVAAQCGETIKLLDTQSLKTLSTTNLLDAQDLKTLSSGPVANGPSNNEHRSNVCSGGISTIALNYDGSLLALGNYCGQVRSYLITTNHEVVTQLSFNFSSDSSNSSTGVIPSGPPITVIAFSPDSPKWAVGTGYGDLWLGDGGRQVFKSNFQGPIGAIKFAPLKGHTESSPTLIFGSGGIVRELNEKNSIIYQLSLSGQITALGLTQKHDYVAVGTDDGDITILNVNPSSAIVSPWIPPTASVAQLLGPTAKFSATPGWIISPNSRQSGSLRQYIFSLQYEADDKLTVGALEARVLEATDRTEFPSLSFTTRDLAFLEKIPYDLCRYLSRNLEIDQANKLNYGAVCEGNIADKPSVTP